jgi:hypothetical protein
MAERGGFYYLHLAQVPMKRYTSVIIACVCAGYKRIRSQATVSIVSLIGCSFNENGITGISLARKRVTLARRTPYSDLTISQQQRCPVKIAGRYFCLLPALLRRGALRIGTSVRTVTADPITP